MNSSSRSRAVPVTTSRHDAATALDPVVAVRGASRGFTVLAIGAVVQPWVGHLLPPLGYVWLVIVAVTAFAVAAWSAGPTPWPARQGVVAAGGAYALMLPLVHLATGSIDPVQATGTTITAIVVGAATGWLRGLADRSSSRTGR